MIIDEKTVLKNCWVN